MSSSAEAHSSIPNFSQSPPEGSRYQSSSTVNDDGFLGVVARWGEDSQPSHTSTSSNGIRSSRILGSRFGVSPPPPPGPPPSLPPPLPPMSALPTDNTSALGQSASISSTTGSIRRSNAPPFPPPTAVLPPLSSTQDQASSSYASGSSHVPRDSTSTKPSKPRSPTGPSISPRNSSLISPMRVAQAEYQGTSPVASSSNAGERGNNRSSRTPSRHLLQTALDLAQQAVEMDKNNDVLGALKAYREAVSRLKSVMERVGVEPNKEDGKRRRSAVGRTEEEGRTLKGIHDAYVARIQLLSSFERQAELSARGPESPQHAHPSTSTATLVPQRDLQSADPDNVPGHHTPRASLDETTDGIGNLMLNDTTISSMGSPERQSRTGPPAFVSPVTNRTSSLQNLSESFTHSHSTSASFDSRDRPASIDEMAESSNAAYRSTLLDSPVSSRSSHHHGQNYGSRDSGGQQQLLSSRMSLPRRPPRGSAAGLESELSLGENDADNMEILDRTPRHGPSNAAAGDEPPAGPLAQQQQSPRSRSEAHVENKQLPPLPNSAPVPSAGLGRATVQGDSGSSTAQFLVSPSTAHGTISQRRQSRGTDGLPVTACSHFGSIDGLPTTSGALFPSSSGINQRQPPLAAAPPRIRTRSQPNRSSQPPSDGVPPLPNNVRHKASFGSSYQARIASASSSTSHGNGAGGLRISTDHGASLAPPPSGFSTASTPRSLPIPLPGSSVTVGSLISPIPESQPREIIHRPFHVLRMLCLSMDPESSGAYLSGTLHLSSAVWKPSNWSKIGPNGQVIKPLGPPKILAQDVKVRVLESLIMHLEIIKQAGGRLFDGKRQILYNGGTPNGAQTMLQAVCEDLCGSLDALDEEMDQCHKLLSKAGVDVGPWKGKGKKTGNGLSWGSRFSKTMDKMTNSKALDSPDKYVDLLSNFCYTSQVIDEHLLCFSGLCTPAYATLPEGSYRAIEARVSRAAEFVGVVIVPFIMDDAKQFLYRYLKGGLKYLEE